MSDGLKALEARIGHRFSDMALLEGALTHSSLSGDRTVRDLERLEFLGDRVLGLFAAESLWRRYPDMEEGALAPRLNALVRKEWRVPDSYKFGESEVVPMRAGETLAWQLR